MFSEDIHTALKSKEFQRLDEDDWKEVILDLIQSDEDMHAAFEVRRPIRVGGIGRIHADMALGLSRDSEVAVIFKHSLPSNAKIKFCDALTKTVLHRYEGWAQDDYLLLVLQRVLKFAVSFGGAIEAPLAERIALDTKLDPKIRTLVSPHLLLEYSFRAIPSDVFWGELEKKMLGSPRICALLMSHYVQRMPEHALMLLAQVTPSYDIECLEIPCRKALGNLSVRSDSENRLQSILDSLPAWARKMILALQSFPIRPV
jgi:hypothetical protein